MSQNTYVLPPLLITPKGNPMSPLKNMAAPSPAKYKPTKFTKKLAAFRTLAHEAREETEEEYFESRPPLVGTLR